MTRYSVSILLVIGVVTLTVQFSTAQESAFRELRSADAQTPGQSVPAPPNVPRTVQRRIGQPLDQLLTASDRELVVVDTMRTTGNSEVDPSGSKLASLARQHDFIAIVEVTGVESALTADRTWIRSTVTGRIVDVWQTGPSVPSQYGAASEVSFQWDGGTTVIDGRRVTAQVSWSGPLTAGKQYLVFGWFPNGEFRVPLTNVYEQRGQSFRSVSRKADRTSDDIERESLPTVKARVAAARRKQ